MCCDWSKTVFRSKQLDYKLEISKRAIVDESEGRVNNLTEFKNE